MASIINATTTNGLVSSADNSGILQLATSNGVTALTINGSQNVGIGTTAPTRPLVVSSTGADIQVGVINSGTAASDDAYMLLQTSATGTTATVSGLFFGDGDSTSVGQFRYNHNNDSITLYTNSAVAFTLSATGGITIERDAVTATPVANDGNLFSGTYTPVQVSTNTNVAAVTFSLCQYMRLGNTVTVSGQIVIDPTSSSTDTVVKMSLPIASSFNNSRQLGGVGSCVTGGVFGLETIAFLASAANECVEMRLNPTVNSALTYNFSFTYQVL